MTITRSTDWTIAEIKAAEEDGNVELLTVSRQDARKLYTELPDEAEYLDDFTSYLDEAQGDCTDGRPRYLILKIGE